MYFRNDYKESIHFTFPYAGTNRTGSKGISQSAAADTPKVW